MVNIINKRVINLAKHIYTSLFLQFTTCKIRWYFFVSFCKHELGSRDKNKTRTAHIPGGPLDFVSPLVSYFTSDLNGVRRRSKKSSPRKPNRVQSFLSSPAVRKRRFRHPFLRKKITSLIFLLSLFFLFKLNY